MLEIPRIGLSTALPPGVEVALVLRARGVERPCGDSALPAAGAGVRGAAGRAGGGFAVLSRGVEVTGTWLLLVTTLLGADRAGQVRPTGRVACTKVIRPNRWSVCATSRASANPASVSSVTIPLPWLRATTGLCATRDRSTCGRCRST